MSIVSAYCLVCTVHGFDMRIRLIVGLCLWHVLELDESLRCIIEHEEMDIFVDVVPVDIHSKIACTAPVLGAFVVFFQDAREVLDVFTTNVLDAKVINTECEEYWKNCVAIGQV